MSTVINTVSTCDVCGKLTSEPTNWLTLRTWGANGTADKRLMIGPFVKNRTPNIAEKEIDSCGVRCTLKIVRGYLGKKKKPR